MQLLRSICPAILLFCCAVCLATAAFADPLEDAQTAYKQQDYKTALQLWQPLAEQGNASAQYSLGIMYDNGFGVKKDYLQAVDWFRRAAVQGNAAAERHYEADNFAWQLGLPEVAQEKTTDKVIAAITNSKAMPQKEMQRMEAIEPAAGKAITQPPIQLVAPAVSQPTETRAGIPDADIIKQLNNLAEQGNAEAQRDLAFFYAQGKGVAQDYDLAVQWYKKAVAQGDAEAQTALGNLYNTGTGVPRSYTEAATLYRLAGDQGNAGAQTELGTLYVLGRGVPRDYAQAAQWYAKAAEQGDAEAQTELGTLYAGGLGVTQDYAVAKKWYEQAALQGNAKARKQLDRIYYRLDAPQDTTVIQAPDQPPASATGEAQQPGQAPSSDVTLLEQTGPKQMSLKTQQGFDIGAQISQYHYREKVPGADPFMEDWGKKYGIEGGYTYVFPSYDVFVRAEGRYVGGTVNYTSSNGLQITGIPERTWEVRALEGMDLDLGTLDLSPYIGFGFRHFWDNNGAGSDPGPGGYIRDINYQYIPLGLTNRIRLGEQARLATNLEYDFLAGGTVFSGLSAVMPGWTDVTNRQSKGIGARGSILFEMAGWSVGPWVNYWHISRSNIACAVQGCGDEPDNRTTELGFKIVKDFW